MEDNSKLIEYITTGLNKRNKGYASFQKLDFTKDDIEVILEKIKEFTELNSVKNKLSKANENIRVLVGDIVSMEKTEGANYCPRVHNDSCDGCDKCKEKFYNEREQSMLDQYLIE